MSFHSYIQILLQNGYTFLGGYLYIEPKLDELIANKYDPNCKQILYIGGDYSENYPFLDKYPNLTVLRQTFNKSTKRNNEFIIPSTFGVVAGNENMLPLVPINKPRISFCGCSNTYPTRLKLLNLLKSSDKVICNFKYNDSPCMGLIEPNIQEKIKDFNDLLEISEYVFCPRGNGNFSIRFYEGLKSGKIPILLETDNELPFENIFDWKSICIISRDETTLIDDILNFHKNNDIYKLQIRCKEVYNELFSNETCGQIMYKHITNIHIKEPVVPLSDKKIYLLGENSFLGKNAYVQLKKQYNNIVLLSHNDIDVLSTAKKDDIVINFCGVNRADTYDDYERANYLLLKQIVTQLNGNQPFFIHVSSLMVYGFKNKNVDDLGNYQKWFIKTKLEGEQFLKENYNTDKLCIIRPSNVYGYSCTPYYNNLLSTMVYEKINGLSKINKINKNCVRNMISVEGFCKEILRIVTNKTGGTFNIVSNNTVTLDVLTNLLYCGTIPDTITLQDGDQDVSNLESDTIKGVNVLVEEDLCHKIKQLETDMAVYLKLLEQVKIYKLNKLVQPRGEMVEISSLESKRLYKITLSENSVRGNHFHYKQIEEFYTNRGIVLYLLAYSEYPDVIYIVKSVENDMIRIEPNIIHTLTNDYINNHSEIIVMSTQEYIRNEIPDTKYVNII
jgi:dTDP-4-dehydrorhamnose reductase